MSSKSAWFLKALMVGALAWSGAALAADKVYVANEGDDSVSVLDAATLQTLASVRVGKMPHNVQVTPDGAMVWVTNSGEPDAAAGAAGHQDGAHGQGHGSHGDAHGQGAAQPGAIWAIDTATNAVVAKVAVGAHPAHVVVSPDGRRAYVSNGGDNTVTVVDTVGRRQLATIPVGRYPHGLRFSPDGKEVYVANLEGGTVSVIDTASQQEVAQVSAGKGPAQVGFTADGRMAFVSLSKENAVAVIDPATRQVTRRIAVGSVPIQLHATPDSRTLVVANQGSPEAPGNSVSLIDLQSFTVTKTRVTGDGAHGVAVDREGRYAYVTNMYANSVSMVDLAEQKVVKTVPVGKSPNGISVTP